MSGPCPRSELTSGGHTYAPDGQGGFRCSFCGIGAPFLVDGTYPAPAAPRLADALKGLLDYTLALELVAYDTVERRYEHPKVTAARAALREAGHEDA